MMYLRPCALTKPFLFESTKSMSYSALTMSKRSDLTKEKQSQIVKSLSKGKTTNDIAKKLQRDHRTIKRYVRNSQDGRKPRVDKACQTLSSQEPSRIQWEVGKRPSAASKTIFEAVELNDVPRSTSLRRVAKVQKAKTRPPLKKIRQEKQLE